MQFDFIGMQATYLALAREDARPARHGPRGSARRSTRPASGRRSCATTTSSRSTSSATPSARRCSPPSVRSPEMQVFDRGLKRRLPDHARRRPAADPDGLQPDVLPARHPDALLRRGDRDGGGPRGRRPDGGPHPDAVERAAATEASPQRRPVAPDPARRDRAPAAPSTSTSSRRCTTPTRCGASCASSSASGVPAPSWDGGRGASSTSRSGACWCSGASSTAPRS